MTDKNRDVALTYTISDKDVANDVDASYLLYEIEYVLKKPVSVSKRHLRMITKVLPRENRASELVYKDIEINTRAK